MFYRYIYFKIPYFVSLGFFLEESIGLCVSDRLLFIDNAKKKRKIYCIVNVLIVIAWFMILNFLR